MLVLLRLALRNLLCPRLFHGSAGELEATVTCGVLRVGRVARTTPVDSNGMNATPELFAVCHRFPDLNMSQCGCLCTKPTVWGRHVVVSWTFLEFSQTNNFMGQVQCSKRLLLI